VTQAPLAILLQIVPYSGKGALPGIVVAALGLAGLLWLPREIARFKSKEATMGQLIVVIAIDSAFVLGGLLMYLKSS
jgi:hypothetical protein